jgi:hypothetical protein
MFDALYTYYGKTFDQLNEEGKDGYLIIKLTVPCKLLAELYIKFTKEGIDKITELPQEKKQKYWNIAMKYFVSTEDRIQASKAAYVLALITSTD